MFAFVRAASKFDREQIINENLSIEPCFRHHVPPQSENEENVSIYFLLQHNKKENDESMS